MTTVIEIVGWGGIVPTVVSVIVYVFCLRCLPAATAQRHAPAAAVGIAFFVGYALLPNWAPLQPVRHWQWLPYVGAAAMIVGPVSAAVGVHRMERWLLYALLAIVAGWLLVPAWANLQPARPVWVCLLAGYLLCLMAMLDGLPDRLLGSWFYALLTLVALGVAILLAAAVSLKFGQIAGIAASAIVGCWIATLFDKKTCLARSVIPIFALLIGGSAFVGCIEPQPPQLRILLAVAAPLVLWLFVRGPLAALDGKRTVMAQSAAVLTCVGTIVFWVLAS